MGDLKVNLCKELLTPAEHPFVFERCVIFVIRTTVFTSFKKEASVPLICAKFVCGVNRDVKLGSDADRPSAKMLSAGGGWRK